jgi:hypothetical protein
MTVITETEKKKQHQQQQDQMMVNLMMQLLDLKEQFRQNTHELYEMKCKRLPLLTGDYKKKAYDQ